VAKDTYLANWGNILISLIDPGSANSRWVQSSGVVNHPEPVSRPSSSLWAISGLLDPIAIGGKLQMDHLGIIAG